MYWTDTHPEQPSHNYSMCRSRCVQYEYVTCSQFPSGTQNGPRDDVKAICESPAKPFFNKPYKRKSWARCSPLTPHMKPDSLRPPPRLFQSLLSVWRLSPEITLGFHKSHPCVVKSHSVFYSRAEPDPVTRMQNPSLFTAPWQPLSDLVILHCVICATSDKTALNSGEPRCHSQVYFYMWKIRQLAHSTAD